MEIIILGLLIIQKSTIYEMRKRIETHFTSISSNSMGSIQATIKKLLAGSMIVCNEYVENSVNKKVYEITDKGKVYFINSVSKPMLYKEKNMELGKLLFMGFVQKNKRLDLIESYIKELDNSREKLKQVRLLTPDNETAISNYIKYLDTTNTTDNFQEMFDTDSLTESIEDILKFQYAALELSIAKVEFEIKWFDDFKKRLALTNKSKSIGGK